MKKIILFLFIFLVLISTRTLADLGSIPFIEGSQIFEPNQEALIAWNGKQEILILSTELYASEKTKVLQVLPLPNKPEVKRSNRDIFKKADKFIIQKNFKQLRQPTLRSTESQNPAAAVKNEVVIGAHDILVAEVLNQEYFVNWVSDYLKDRGEKNPQIPESLKNTITNYINRGYNYFVFDTVEVGPEPEFNQAISYQFQSSELYYPLQITNSDHGSSKIKLLILTDQNLINYNGIEQDRIREKNRPVRLNSEETAYISNSIAELFSRNLSEQQGEDKKISLLNWSLKNNSASFDKDLLIDQQIAELMKNKIVYQGTTFIDYKADPNYPYPSKKKIESISGKVKERMGSRMYPWSASAVNGKVLFNAKTENLLQNFTAEDKNVTVEGYSSQQGLIIMRDPFDSMPKIIGIDDVFYVTEIVGWKPYSGIALSSEGRLNNKRTHFWLKDK